MSEEQRLKDELLRRLLEWLIHLRVMFYIEYYVLEGSSKNVNLLGYQLYLSYKDMLTFCINNYSPVLPVDHRTSV